MEQTDLSNSVLILGFFDGIHLGHRNVLKSAISYAKRNILETVLLTFTNSPAEYFKNNTEYIYPRNYNFQIIKKLGINYIIENDFSKLVNISAEDYLNLVTEKYRPKAIFTGFNYTFGKNRQGTPQFLDLKKNEYGYEYFCINPVKSKEYIVSSTLIKSLLQNGETEMANIMLCEPFTIESSVIKGNQIGRTIGFPTANMIYPDKIVKIPYGVYKVKVLNSTGVLNWGIKPTLNGNSPILEVHIPNFNGDLYGKRLKIQILNKIRDEKKFDSLEELKIQITKDTEECLKSL